MGNPEIDELCQRIYKNHQRALELIWNRIKGGREGKDRFGSKLESQAAAINAAVTDQPQTPEEIHKTVKIKHQDVDLNRVKTHLKRMIERGHAVQTQQGYALANQVQPKTDQESAKPIQLLDKR